MRKCEGCGKPDAPFYDYKQECTCGNERKPTIDNHAPDCFRVCHSITPYMAQLRRATRRDAFSGAQLLAPAAKEHEYARLIKEGFRIELLNGYIYYVRYICADCVRIWCEREENRQHFEKAKRGTTSQNYYQVLTGN